MCSEEARITLAQFPRFTGTVERVYGYNHDLLEYKLGKLIHTKTHHIEEWFDEQMRHHREGDNPAFVTTDYGEVKKWFIHGSLKRENDKPTVEGANGMMEWRTSEDKLHRENDLPAKVCKNFHSWHRNGKRHRDEDRPAYVSQNVCEWYDHGIQRRKLCRPSRVRLNQGELVNQEINSFEDEARFWGKKIGTVLTFTSLVEDDMFTILEVIKGDEKPPEFLP